MELARLVILVGCGSPDFADAWCCCPACTCLFSFVADEADWDVEAGMLLMERRPFGMDAMAQAAMSRMDGQCFTGATAYNRMQQS